MRENKHNKANMRSRRRQQIKKRRRVLIAEIVTICVLSVVLFGAIWFARKMSLVNHVELDDTKVHTSTEFNNKQNTQTAQATDGTQQQTPAASDQQAQQQTANLTGVDVIALVGLDSRPDEAEVKNSDTMIICVLDHNAKTIKLCSVMRDTYLNIIEDYYGNPDYYAKANAAYNYGGPEQFLSMLNLNLDLDITEFITVDFTALAKVVDLLGGLDINMTKQELIHVNNYNVETSEICGVEYEEIPVPDDPDFDGYIARTFHVNGSQAVSYARIRYTEGYDFKRASRQREVLSLIKQKAATMDLGTLDSILNEVLPMVTTNIDNMKLITTATSILTYQMTEEDQAGFPFVHYEDDGSLTGTDCVIPVTLAYNVQLLHEFLFPDQEYVPKETMLEYSYQISMQTGLTEEDIDYCAQQGDLADVPKYTEEEYQQALEAEQEQY